MDIINKLIVKERRLSIDSKLDYRVALPSIDSRRQVYVLAG